LDGKEDEPYFPIIRTGPEYEKPHSSIPNYGPKSNASPNYPPKPVYFPMRTSGASIYESSEKDVNADHAQQLQPSLP
jgi:hypothetical protein